MRGKLVICLSCGEVKQKCQCDDIIKLMQSQLEHQDCCQERKKITMNCIKQIHNNTNEVSL